MRDIKFRAWDAANKRLLHNALFFEQRDNYIAENVVKPTNCLITVWEQYIGSVDKNGKEIYEGDIVEFYSSGFIMENSFPIGVVIFEDGKFVVPNCIWGPNGTPFGAATIIGNIHENEDLIAKYDLRSFL